MDSSDKERVCAHWFLEVSGMYGEYNLSLVCLSCPWLACADFGRLRNLRHFLQERKRVRWIGGKVIAGVHFYKDKRVGENEGGGEGVKNRWF